MAPVGIAKNLGVRTIQILITRVKNGFEAVKTTIEHGQEPQNEVFVFLTNEGLISQLKTWLEEE